MTTASLTDLSRDDGAAPVPRSSISEQDPEADSCTRELVDADGGSSGESFGRFCLALGWLLILATVALVLCGSEVRR